MKQALGVAMVLAAAGAGAFSLPGQEQAGQRSVWEGVYSEAQAARGHTQYERSCTNCHGADLQGDAAQEVPPLVEDTFLARWSGRTVQSLFEKISQGMPASNPGSLAAPVYLDIVAYILQANRFPSAQEELGDGRWGLDQLIFAKGPGGGK
jgi:cytochrome c